MDDCSVAEDSGLDEKQAQSIATETDAIVDQAKRGRGRPPKDETELVDSVSAGRKRAAAKVDTKKGAMCEWRYLKFAGGGGAPIIGCPGYPASDLHHGPDKSTLNNSRPEEVGLGEAYNLHYICDWCHSRWHYANDKFYGTNGAGDRPNDNSTWVPLEDYKEHDSLTRLTPAEAMAVEAGRANQKLAKVTH